MTSSDSGPEALPETIQVGKGMTMTFLRDQPYLARIRISGEPDAETLYVPPHWHETHDEFLRVLEGQLEVTLGPITRMYGPHDGEIAIRRGVSHCLRSLKGVECIFEERTDPMDSEKEVFFRNMLARGGPPANVFEAMQVYYYGDTKPALPGGIRWLDKTFVALLGRYMAPMLGYRRKYESL